MVIQVSLLAALFPIEAPDVQSTQNMSRGQLEKLAAEDAKD